MTSSSAAATVFSGVVSGVLFFFGKRCPSPHMEVNLYDHLPQRRKERKGFLGFYPHVFFFAFFASLRRKFI
jgi:hypothetical protein